MLAKGLGNFAVMLQFHAFKTLDLEKLVAFSRDFVFSRGCVQARHCFRLHHCTFRVTPSYGDTFYNSMSCSSLPNLSSDTTYENFPSLFLQFPSDSGNLINLLLSFSHFLIGVMLVPKKKEKGKKKLILAL